MENLRVSVIIPSYNSRTTIENCLKPLEHQTNTEKFEVIVVDSSTDGTAYFVEQQFPNIRLFTFPYRKFPGNTRNFGVSQSKGEILAFTDADCIIAQNWISEIIKAHRNHYPIIGGAIDNGSPESYIGWAYYFSEFRQWMPESLAGPVVDIPTSCLTMKRWAFDKYGPFLEDPYGSDTEFNWRAGKDGYKPLFIPSLKVAHINIASFRGFLKRKFFRGIYFAGARIKKHNFSTLQRIAFVIISPLLPFLLFYRVTRRVYKNGIYLKQFILSSPLVFVGLTAWSCGEFVGSLLKCKKGIASNENSCHRCYI
jgi:glycosyltransferase involved in cell wall biosynthesis